MSSSLELKEVSFASCYGTSRPASQEWWEEVWASRASRERDRPLEATSSEEVNAAFVWLLSAACLVIIPVFMSTGWTFQERSQPDRPTEEWTTHRQQRLTSHSAAEVPDWGRRSKYMKPSVVRRRRADLQPCSRPLRCLDSDTCEAPSVFTLQWTSQHARCTTLYEAVFYIWR